MKQKDYPIDLDPSELEQESCEDVISRKENEDMADKWISNGVIGTYKGVEIEELVSGQRYPFKVKGKYIVDEYKFDKSMISVSYDKGTKMKLFHTADAAVLWIENCN